MFPMPATPVWVSRNDLSGAERPSAMRPSASGVRSSESGSIPTLVERYSSSGSRPSSRVAVPKRRTSVKSICEPSSNSSLIFKKRGSEEDS